MEKDLFDPRLKKRIEILEILIAMIIVALGIISLISYNYLRSQITSGILGFGLIGVFIVTLVIEFIPNVLHPVFGLFVAIVSGFDPFLSTIFCIAGAFVGGILGYEIGRKYGFKLVYISFKTKTVKKILKYKDKYGNIFLFIAAISPVPYLPLVFGALLVKRKHFIFYGLIPRLLSYIALGYLISVGVYSL